MKYRIKQYLGLLLALVLGLALTACGSSNQTASVKVDCTKQTVLLPQANSDLEKAQKKLADATGTPAEKQAQKDVNAAQATVNELNACKPPALAPVSSASKHKVVVDIARRALKQQGYKDKQIKTDHLKKNTADPGRGVFGQAVSTPAEAVAFLKSGTLQAKEAIKAEKKATRGACAPTTTAQLLDESNWVAAQLGTATAWGGNTYYSGGIKMANNAKVDKAGTIVLVFVPPGQVACGKVTSVGSLRGACTNPQFELPRPHVPGTPTQPKPKSKCVPPSIMLPQGVCSGGKNANLAAVPTGGPVVHCKGGYLGRDGQCHTGTYTPPSSGGGGSGGSGSNAGQGDSGPGATNTVAPPPTSQPAPAPPETSSPATPVPTPTM